MAFLGGALTCRGASLPEQALPLAAFLGAGPANHGTERTNLDRKGGVDPELLNHQAAEPDARLAKIRAMPPVGDGDDRADKFEPGFAGGDAFAAGGNAIGMAGR